MRGKTEAKKAAGKPELEFTGSARSQQSIKTQWRLERELKHCQAQIGLWERNLATAEEGKKRQASQIAAGYGYAHAVLETYVQDAVKAEQMIATFKTQAGNLQGQLDALKLTPEKVAKRAKAQRILATQIERRLDKDRELDSALASVRKILEERAALTAEMYEGAAALEFDSSLDLDEGRFRALLHSLPQGMAGDSAKWVIWFLGREGDRRPCIIQFGQATLPETLACNNAFASGDTPNLTKAEEAKIEEIQRAMMPPRPPVLEEAWKPGEPVPEVPPENIQWALASGFMPR
jgi:hypothetical protein